MLLLQAENIKKIYGERIVLDVEELKIYTGDRIGVIGANGAGKSTLFALLAGELEPEAGWIKRFGRISYCRQFGEHGREAFYGEEALYEREALYGEEALHERGALNGEAFHGREVFQEKEVCLQDQVFPEERISSGEYKIWQAPERNEDAISGGELMRRKLAEVFSTRGHILLLDEPTANLDREGIRMLTEKMQRVETFLCISHDRQLLDQVCTSILEVAGGKARLYSGNYSEYEAQKEEERQKAWQDYEEYEQEKSRLEVVYRQKRESAARMRKVPAGMSPREARLRDFLTVSGRNSSGKQKSMNRAADNVKKRIEHMEKKERPRQEMSIRLDFARTNPPESRRVLEVKELDFSYGTRVIFENISFTLSNRKRTARLGPNGSGKTTLLRCLQKAAGTIADGTEETGTPRVQMLKLAPRVRLGVLEQNLKMLNPEKTVLDNALAVSVQLPAVAKNMLAGLLFGPDDWNKRAAVLSGGERMRLGFAMLLLSDANVLLLDEPTNYLDLPSIQALEKQLTAYEGAVLFVSHDSRFVQNVAQELLIIEERKIIKFSGSLEEWEQEKKRLAKQVSGKDPEAVRNERIAGEERMRLELRLARLNGLMGHAPSLEEKERLEAEYWEIVRTLRN